MTASASELCHACNQRAVIRGPAIQRMARPGAQRASSVTSAAPRLSPDAPRHQPERVPPGAPARARSTQDTAASSAAGTRRWLDLRLLLRKRLELRSASASSEPRPVQHAEGVADVADLLRREAATPSILCIHTVRGCRLTRPPSRKGTSRVTAALFAMNACGAHLAELMDSRKSAHDDPVAELDVTAERRGSLRARAGRRRDSRAQHGICHEQIVAADARHAFVLGGTAVQRHVLLITFRSSPIVSRVGSPR